MARAELKFLPWWFKTLHCESIGDSLRKPRRRTLLRSAAVALVGAVALASPSFGQRVSASAGGGASHAGGSPGGGGASSAGSRSSGGFGGRSSGGGSWHGGNSGGARSGGSGTRGNGGNSSRTGAHGFGGRANGSRNGSRGYTRASVERFDPAAGRMERVDQPGKTGFRAALRRFFGIKDSPRFVRADKQTEAMVARDMVRATLPPALSRVRLNEFPGFKQAGSGQHISGLEPRAELRRRPVQPFPRRFGPAKVYSGWYAGYWPAFDFGFPFFFDFSYLNYCGWSGCGQPNVVASPVLLLYLKDGSALEVTDYWVEGVTMRYLTQDGKKGSVAVADIDVQRTTDANARIGLKFRLDRTEPGLPLE